MRDVRHGILYCMPPPHTITTTLVVSFSVPCAAAVLFCRRPGHHQAGKAHGMSPQVPAFARDVSVPLSLMIWATVPVPLRKVVKGDTKFRSKAAGTAMLCPC